VVVCVELLAAAAAVDASEEAQMICEFAAKLDTKLDCKLLLSIFLPRGKGSHSLYEDTYIGVSGQHYYIAEY
jgi:hypothetical protein